MIDLSGDLTIEQVLQAGYYRIPRFQRPYSWTADNVGDLWTDAIQSGADDYFLGAFIVYRLSDDKKSTDYAIVDGQQRLTTITVLLAALRDTFNDCERDDLAMGVQTYIARLDRRNKLRFVLEAEAGFPYLQANVQSYPSAEIADDHTPKADERLLYQAYDYFRNELESLRQSVMGNTTIKVEDRPAAFVDEVETIRDQVLGLNVIFVVVDNEDDAYTIFETLNTRGKDLSLADLVRNFLLRDLKESSSTADLPRDRYNRLLASLQEDSVRLDPSDFLLHSWLSRRSYTSRKKLFREMKVKVATVDKKKALLKELEIDHPLYIKARRPRTVRWTQQQAEVARSLHALNVFNMTQPTPLALAALRAYAVEMTMNLKTLKRLLAAIESFHFQFTAIAGKSSSGGISMRYSTYARACVGATSNKHGVQVDELIGKLRASLPTKEEFLTGFATLKYSSTDTRQKPLVQYVLERHYRHGHGGAATVDFGAMTIEHLASENPHDLSSGANAAVSSIGNLILVSEDLNNKLANKTFAQKQKMLKKEEGLWVDPLVLDASAWGQAEISTRTSAMATIARDEIWKL